MIDILTYIYNEVTPTKVNGKRGKGAKPWIDLHDKDGKAIDESIKGTPNGAPVLYLFFKSGKFEMAEVGVDNVVLHLQAADVVKALTGYVAVFFAFHVGFTNEHVQFLAFLQEALLGVPYTEGKHSLGLTTLLQRFHEALTEHKDSKGFKRLCV